MAMFSKKTTVLLLPDLPAPAAMALPVGAPNQMKSESTPNMRLEPPPGLC